MEVELVLLQLQVHGVLVGVGHIARIVHFVEGNRFGGTVVVEHGVGLRTVSALGGVGIANFEHGCGAVGEVEFGVVLEVLVGTGGLVAQRVGVLARGLRGVDGGGVLAEVDVGVGQHAHALHGVEHRWEHGAELTGAGIGGDGDLLGSICGAVAAGDGATHTVVTVVERPWFRGILPLCGRAGGFLTRVHHVVGFEHDFGHADVVDRTCEAHRFGVFHRTAVHAAGDHHGGVVPEGQAAQFAVEVVLIHLGEATAKHKCVAIALHGDEVMADGDVHGEAAVLTGLNQLTVAAGCRTVDFHQAVFHGVVGALVVNHARHRETAGVSERRTAVDVAGGADEAGHGVGRELVDSQLRAHNVVGAGAAVVDAADDVVAGGIGQGVDTQLRRLGHDEVDGAVGLDGAVVLVGSAVGLGVVVSVALVGSAFVQRPVGQQTALGAGEGVVVIAQNLRFSEHAAGEEAHLVDVTHESVGLAAGGRCTEVDGGGCVGESGVGGRRGGLVQRTVAVDGVELHRRTGVGSGEMGELVGMEADTGHRHVVQHQLEGAVHVGVVTEANLHPGSFKNDGVEACRGGSHVHLHGPFLTGKAVLGLLLVHIPADAAVGAAAAQRVELNDVGGVARRG